MSLILNLLLVAVNTKYIHSNLAIYSLKTYAGMKGIDVDIAEYTINNLQDDILADIYKKKPDLIGFSCYLWNIEMIRGLITELSKLLPKCEIWLGGPEVSYESESMFKSIPQIRGIMLGEGEETYTSVCRAYIAGDNLYEMLQCVKGVMFLNDESKLVRTEMGEYIDMDTIPFVYKHIPPETLRNRIIYYETSRGCPYSCSYCMSSIDRCVRFRSLELVYKELQFFLDNEVEQVKFVDRTFNCNRDRTRAIFKYIIEHDNGITNFHFEVSADILNDEELSLIAKMRPRLIQLEIGVQSTNDETLKAIDRKMNLDTLKDNVNRVLSMNNIHQHLDLIAGLPYEDIKSFRKSFNEVYELRPQQLQLGFLKILKGSPMYNAAKKYGIVYKSSPPYEVLYTRWVSYADILRLKKIENMVETYYNSGQFEYSIRYLEHFFETPFDMFDYIGDYYVDNELLNIGHARISRYDILLEAVKALPICESELIQLLVHDLYLRENMKSRPKLAVGRDECKDELHALMSNEEYVRKLLKGYDNYDTRQIARMTHLERYDIELKATAFNQGRNKKVQYLLYDYINRNPVNHQASCYEIDEDMLIRH